MSKNHEAAAQRKKIRRTLVMKLKPYLSVSRQDQAPCTFQKRANIRDEAKKVQTHGLIKVLDLGLRSKWKGNECAGSTNTWRRGDGKKEFLKTLNDHRISLYSKIFKAIISSWRFELSNFQ
jgi:hypothetical protein